MNDSTRKTTPCPGCNGSGQTSYFAGESRFMLTWEDCPDCAGTGVLLDESAGQEVVPETPEATGDKQSRDHHES